MDDAEQQPPRNFALMAAAFEGGLAVLAVGLGWLLGLKPLESFHWDMSAVGMGVTATLPLLLIFWLCLKAPLRPFRQILRVLDESVLPLFRQCSMLELLIISTLAGLGEEMLFRGIVQGGIADWLARPAGIWIGLAAAAILFGAVHAITPAYAILAGLIGLYLGGLWILTGNLLAPISTHAVYDFLALAYLIKMRKPDTDSP